MRPERDAERAKIQLAGHELAKKTWTWDAAIEQLLAIVREERRQRNMVLQTTSLAVESSSEVAPLLKKKSLPKAEGDPMKLHIACGPKHIEGYLNTDLRPGPAVDKVLDAREPLPVSVYSEIYACHVLEHFYVEETPDILRNWFQSLRPEGVLRLAVPDLRLVVANCVETHAFGKNPNGPLYGDYRKNAQEPDRHKQVFILESLTKLLTSIGFKDILPWKSTEVPEIHAVKDWSSFDSISLNLLGRK